MLEPSPAPIATTYVANDASPTAAAALQARQDDYAWTHSAPVEGFFLVLTIVIVPVALVRWTRRLRNLSRSGARRPPRAAPEEV